MQRLRPVSSLVLVLGLVATGCRSPAPNASSSLASVPVAISADGAALGEEVLPGVVATAVFAAVPDARLLAASRELDGNETTYEVLVETEEGTLEVDVSRDGRVLEIDAAADDERAISPADLPGAVVDAVEAAVPGGRITAAVRQTVRGDVVYDVEVDVRGRKFDLEIAPDGTVLEVDEGN